MTIINGKALTRNDEEEKKIYYKSSESGLFSTTPCPYIEGNNVGGPDCFRCKSHLKSSLFHQNVTCELKN